MNPTFKKIIFVIFIIYVNKFEVSSFPFYGTYPWEINDYLYPNTDIDQNYIVDEDGEEIIHISTLPSRNYTINAFGRSIQLSLEPNNVLIPDSFTTKIVNGKKSFILIEKPESCHYLHRMNIAQSLTSEKWTTAALSFCQTGIVTGFIILEEITFEIKPLLPHLYTQASTNENGETAETEGLQHEYDKVDRTEKDYVVPHIIKKANLPPKLALAHDNIYATSENDERYNGVIKQFSSKLSPAKYDNEASSRFTLEVALFFDEAGFKLFKGYMKNDYTRIRNMLLAYLNGVQALYHHPSIGKRLDIALVRLEIFKTQPIDLPTFYGERSQLLNSFCSFNEKHNPNGDSNPGHWDIGLYVSGLDFYAIENGQKSDITMGLSAVGGVCMEKYSCVIAEFGTTNAFNKPYPSAGFTSVYVMAHEIGHNLGMHHDGSLNDCPKDGYLMSASRSMMGGETQWSRCSAQVMQKLGSHPCLTDSPNGKVIEREKQGGDTPGMMWDAKKQCEILLRDRDANPIAKINEGSNSNDICQNLECETPHRTGRYFAGPALDGTSCGNGKWCVAGECMKRNSKLKENVVKGGWSKWHEETCESGCIIKSKGYQVRSRSCDNPEPVNTDRGCEGPTFEVNLCNDDKVCKSSKRISATDYATKKCNQFSTFLNHIDGMASGLQAPHETSRIWVACTVYCKVKDRRGNIGYYTPRVEFNDLDVDPYFPDGTWCHNDKKHNYYCQQHKCLPMGAQVTTRNVIEDLHELVQNAWPSIKINGTINNNTSSDVNNHIQEDLIKYLSLDDSGRPLLTNLPDQPFPIPGFKEWTDEHDYIDLTIN